MRSPHPAMPAGAGRASGAPPQCWAPVGRRTRTLVGIVRRDLGIIGDMGPERHVCRSIAELAP
ncbi:hypothetical protein WME94_19850 [Sorangium sp. So ce429]